MSLTTEAGFPPSVEPPLRPEPGSAPRGSERRPPKTLPTRLADGVVHALAAGLLLAGTLATAWSLRHAWEIHSLRRGVGDTVFYSADGKPWFRLDEHRRDVPLEKIAPHLRQAVIAAEDHRFYYHPGIDPIALARAAVRNVQERAWAEGGSTLTQQLARTLFLSNSRSFSRKLKEAALALMLEQQLSKQQILELYLNRVYMGAGRYGVEAMARATFGRSAADVSLAQAAVLAGLVRAPSTLSPWSNWNGARERSRVVLARMREERYISEKAEQSAGRERLKIGPQPSTLDARGGYAKEYLRQQFQERFGGDHPPDWRVQTTFVPALQEQAERAVAQGLERLRVRGLQAALVALDPQTGDVLALVGGSDARSHPFNRAVRSRRQPGSAFKPIVFAAALERGLGPVDVLEDLHSVKAAAQGDWAPGHAPDAADTLTLRQALVESDNAAAVALQQRVGTGAVLDLARDLGLRELPSVPSLALGTGLSTPLELTAAFAAFANGGYAVEPRAILQVTEKDGALALDRPTRRRRVLSEPAAFQMLSMLRDVVERGTASGAWDLGVRFPAAGKTGTTDDFRDAWFVGFSSSLVAGVWVGLDQPATIREQGYAARVALPIWADFMRRTTRLRPPQEFEVPWGLQPVELCRVSYLRPAEDCPTYVEHLKRGDDVPERECPLHRESFEEKVEEWLERLKRRFRDILEE
jgi:1A family penicillin-binding protein